MSEITMSASVTRRVVLSDTDEVATRKRPYSEAIYRPRWLHEELFVHPDRAIEYTVNVGGPVLKKDGTPHACQTGGNHYYRLNDVPDDLRRHLVGPGALLRGLRLPYDEAAA